MIDIYLANPRGFCSGVERAIGLVEKVLEEFGAPIYVRHEIVHNKHVIEKLRTKGVVFIENFEQIQDKSRPVIISAHGAAKAVFKQAQDLGLKLFDATCPLVKNVHHHIEDFFKKDMEIVVIGKKNHAEIIGTVGQVEDASKIHIINKIEDVAKLEVLQNKKIAFVTQTTLCVDDTIELIHALKAKYPAIQSMKENDICYATTHRQKAVKEMAKMVDAVLVVGSKNSSNSKNLQEAALSSGKKKAFLVDDAGEIDWNELDGLQKIGISSGASAPEHLLDEIVKEFEKRYKKINIHNAKI